MSQNIYRQKSLIRRWTFSVLFISRFIFWVMEKLPESLMPNFWGNHSWIDFSVVLGDETIALNIPHQFIDPIILAIIAWLAIKLFFEFTGAVTRITILCFFTPLVVWITYLMFYKVPGNSVVGEFLDFANALGNLFLGITLLVVFVVVVRFLILGAIKFFQDDKKKWAS